jgi:AraC family transcriptional regulator of adaptative response/methylated-DNA-[protein]-cysteine methyltransferase
MKQHWVGATFARRPDLTEAVAKRIFSGLENEKQSSLSLLLLGTNFQIKVWQALLELGARDRTNYSAIADAIGASSSSRAVAGAVGANSIAYLIPCHHVLRKSGSLGGYRWGEDRKRAMLAWEAIAVQTPPAGAHSAPRAARVS